MYIYSKLLGFWLLWKWASVSYAWKCRIVLLLPNRSSSHYKAVMLTQSPPFGHRLAISPRLHLSISRCSCEDYINWRDSQKRFHILHRLTQAFRALCKVRGQQVRLTRCPVSNTAGANLIGLDNSPLFPQKQFVVALQLPWHTLRPNTDPRLQNN